MLCKISTDKKKGSKDCPFKILFRKRGITFAFFGTIFALINTSSKSSLQSSLQNHTKREGYEKVTSF